MLNLIVDSKLLDVLRMTHEAANFAAELSTEAILPERPSARPGSTLFDGHIKQDMWW